MPSAIGQKRVVLKLLRITKQSPPPYLAWGGGFGLSAGVPWGVDFLLLLRLALGGGFRLSAGLPGGFAFAN